MNHLKSNRRGWEKLKKRLQRFDKRAVDIGFFRNQKYGPENDSLYVAEVAYINDQGSMTVPPRPFLTVDFESHVRRNFLKDSKAIFVKLLLNKNFFYQQELQALGQKYKDSLRTIIFDYPGSNSPAWVEQKGFDDPLFHTGQMVESVEYRIKTPKQVHKRGS